MNDTIDNLNSASPAVQRIEIHPQDGQIDPAADRLQGEAKKFFGQIEKVHTARIYLIQGAFANSDIQQIAHELLADPITQNAVLGAEATKENQVTLDIHYLPGVMDPAAQSVHDAITQMFESSTNHSAWDNTNFQVSTGFRYDFTFAKSADVPGADQLQKFATSHLANTVVQAIYLEPYHPDHFPSTEPYKLNVTNVAIRDLDDAALAKLSREGHLFLDNQEMAAIRDYYKKADREPTDIELETIAQTWSEHCVHKTLKAKISYQPLGPDGAIDFSNRPGHTINEDGSITIDNLLKQTIAAATFKLMEHEPGKEWCISVFDDNAGIVKLDDEHGIAIKVETHNHPSAIEPYGGAATGIGGCIRDIIGTGLAAKPIANTDVFCVARPDTDEKNLPDGVIHPKRVLQRVVDGVRDYGNRMGIPTVNGAVWFHDDFLGNPLVFAGCVGLIPLDKCFGKVNPGDRIIALGGATGRDGIHGATFSSAELTGTHADEFSHAVQIGNPITEKKVLDVILQARDAKDGPLFSGLTDCGAGGFSSAVGEMGEKVGAYVTLDTAPLKYQGLSYTEIWISEAQERLVLSVPEEKIAQLKALCQREDVLFCDLGHFGNCSDDDKDSALLTLTYQGTTVGQLPMEFLHDGLPAPTRKATWSTGRVPARRDPPATDNKEAGGTPASPPPALPDIDETLKRLLSHPNIASKHWIIRQYDHEVQGGSTIKPLVGPHQNGPSDGAVLRPKLGSNSGVVIAGGMAPNLSEKMRETGMSIDGDSYFATLAAIDEAVRNAVCVGADPEHIALLDNFCWPSCDDPAQLGSLVRAAEACYDGALAYSAPFVSGKDSLSNQFTTKDGSVITIPQTLLITALSTIDNVLLCRTMDAKKAGNALLLMGKTTENMGGSHFNMLGCGAGILPASSPDSQKQEAAKMAAAQKTQDLNCGGGFQPASANDSSTQKKSEKIYSPQEIAYQSEPNIKAGSCLLKNHREAQIVQDALLHFNEQRYLLHSWCVMPNHVHAVVSPFANYRLKDILHSWKSFTSNQINQSLNREGKLWERESFDHLIRRADAVDGFISYVQNNPVKANLCSKPEDWPFSDCGTGISSASDCGAGFQPASSPTFQKQEAAKMAAPQKTPYVQFVDPHTTPFTNPRTRGELTHLEKAGATYFVTFRLRDAVISHKDKEQEANCGAGFQPASSYPKDREQQEAARMAAPQNLNNKIPRVDIKQGPANARVVAKLIADGLVDSAHDCSDGGLLVAAAEMAFSGGVGLDMDLSALTSDNKLSDLAACFAETPSRYLLEIKPENLDTVTSTLKNKNIPHSQVGSFQSHQKLTLKSDGKPLIDEPLNALRETWQKPLDW